MSQSIDQLIKDDHEHIRMLYNKAKIEPDPTVKQRLVNSFIRELSIHSDAEEEVLYPAYSKYMPNGSNEADKARSEHLQIKKAVKNIDGLDVKGESFDDKFTYAFLKFEEHSIDEENNELPALVNSCEPQTLLKLGRKFARVKAFVPTHPHPHAPQKPPLHTVAGLMTTPIDKTRDLFRKFTRSDSSSSSSSEDEGQATPSSSTLPLPPPAPMMPQTAFEDRYQRQQDEEPLDEEPTTG